MAKTYAFNFVATPAKFEDGCVSMEISMMTPRHEKVMTWAEAQAYLVEFSKAEPGPHVATLHMINRRERRPSGYDALKPIYKREA